MFVIAMTFWNKLERIAKPEDDIKISSDSSTEMGNFWSASQMQPHNKIGLAHSNEINSKSFVLTSWFHKTSSRNNIIIFRLLKDLLSAV